MELGVISPPKEMHQSASNGSVKNDFNTNSMSPFRSTLTQKKLKGFRKATNPAVVEEMEKLSKTLALSNLTKTVAATGNGSFMEDYTNYFGSKKRSVPAGSIRTNLPDIKTFSPNNKNNDISVMSKTLGNRATSIVVDPKKNDPFELKSRSASAMGKKEVHLPGQSNKSGEPVDIYHELAMDDFKKYQMEAKFKKDTLKRR